MTASHAARRRPRTASRAVRRRQLIEATIVCIAEHGISGTTMAKVTQEAGLSMGLVSFHFESKENLLLETLLHLAEEHRARWHERLADSELAPEAKLAAVVDAHFDPAICNETRIAVWFAFFGEARYRAVYLEKIAHFDTERTAVVTELCAEIAGEGYQGVDIDEVTRNLECLADGLWLSVMVYPRWLTREAAHAQARSYLRHVFPRHFAVWPGEGGAAGPCAQRYEEAS